jgi:hypothetical protein
MSNAEDWTEQLGAFLETTARITETWLTQTVDTTPGCSGCDQLYIPQPLLPILGEGEPETLCPTSPSPIFGRGGPLA